jgi:tryptophanyl-tRNA synthetase
MKKVVLSGIQPSGSLHIGNYIGALSQWVKMQDDYDCITMIADLHALTVPQDPKELPNKIKETVAVFLASGIDPDKSHIFIQSQNADHAYLAWIFQTITGLGQLERMTQFKDKAQKQGTESASVGLLTYPTLMAADILLYDADEVPVGEDQKQHLEITRDIAEKFNKTYGETFKLPNPRIPKDSARIMSLQNPDRKMSKSDNDPLGTINILDSEEQIREKIKKAVTDSGSTIGEQGSAAITNLLEIYGAMKDLSFEESLKLNEGKSYAEFKAELADAIVERLTPVRQKYEEIMKDEANLNDVLSKGLEYSMDKTTKKVQDVRAKVGLI